MGNYDTVGARDLQIKCVYHPTPTMEHFNIGDKIPLADGVYICYEGWFVVQDGIVFAEGEKVFDKYGGEVETEALVDRENPVAFEVKTWENKQKINQRRKQWNS